MQAQGAKLLKSSGAKFPPVKVGDSVRIRISDVDRGRGDPQSVLAVVINVEEGFYKNRTWCSQKTVFQKGVFHSAQETTHG